MGQYFTPIFLNSTGTIVHALEPTDYGSACKLAGHTRADAPLMYAVLTLLALDGGFSLVWAGDYAEPQPGGAANLYYQSEPRHFLRFEGLVASDVEANMALPAGNRSEVFGYVCNPKKRQYIENLTLPIDDTGWRRTPLPILTAEGGPATPTTPTTRVGSWARDPIYYSHRCPGTHWTPVSHPV
jgi:hypothetical protein